jgi:hypothetical protein
MSRRIGDRFRQIAPDRGRVIAFLVLFVVFEGFVRYIESLGIPISSRLPIRPASGLLFLAAAVYGIARVTSFHPVFQKEYQSWLQTTPWHNRKPLPLGPVELVPEDGLVLAPLLLLSATLPQPRAMPLLCAFLLCHLGALVIGLWLTHSRAVGYLSAFGLGFAVKLWHQPVECLAMAALVYLVAYEGLVQALDRFPWATRQVAEMRNALAALNTGASNPGSSAKEPCGWPHDRMMGEVRNAEGIPRLDAVICCALASWWLYVVGSFIPEEKNRLGALMLACQFPYMLSPWVRIAIYAQGYLPPISLWGRIRTMRWIIPGYDQIFVAPICAFVAGPAVFGLLFLGGVHLDACIPVGAAASVAVALVAPPRLLRWRLTGQHRIASGLSTANTAFVKVG